jgi:hypothetical protein
MKNDVRFGFAAFIACALIALGVLSYFGLV